MLQVFPDGIEDGLDLKVHIGKSAYVDADDFHGYLCDILLPKIEEFRQMSEMIDAPAVLLMDNCLAHVAPATIQFLSDHRVKAITFRPCTSAIFQMLDLVFFGVFKRSKRHLVKNPAVPVLVDHATRMFKAAETADASSTVRASFIHARFICELKPDGGYALGFNKVTVRDSSVFKEVRNIHFPIEMLSPRRRDTPWGSLNWEAFQSQNNRRTTL
jgi:hypothetical protein